MGVEQRNGRLYYTVSKRVQGKVKREYIGSDALGLLAYLIDQQKRHEQQAQNRRRHEEWQKERQVATALNEMVGTVCEHAEMMFHAAMEASGYHQHARSEWRRKRQEKFNHE